MTWPIYFLALIPTLYEAISDRFGESKKDKISDFWLAFSCSIFAATILWMLGYNPILFLMMVIAWRVLCFDYLVQYLLIRKGVIVGHWFTYNGKTSWFDQLVSKVHPVLRLVIRVAFFVGCSFYFWSQY
jgi:hypothetical protein